MKRLGIAGEYRSLGLEGAGIVQRARFDNCAVRPCRRFSAQARPAGLAEVARDRIIEVRPGEAGRRFLRPAERFVRKHGERVRVPAGDVLTLPAMTLDLCLWLRGDFVPDAAAIASTCYRHRLVYPFCLSVLVPLKIPRVV